MKKISRNLKFFLPLLFKISPSIPFMLILRVILVAGRNMATIILPALIIKQLTGSKDVDKIVIIVGSYILILFISQVLLSITSIIQDNKSSIAYYEVQNMFGEKLSTIDYFQIEDPKFIDFAVRARQGMMNYTNGIYVSIYTIEDVLIGIISLISTIGLVIYSGNIYIIITSVIGIILSIFLYQKIQDNEQLMRNDSNTRYRLLSYFTRSIALFRNQKEIRLYNGKKIIEEKLNSTIEEHRKRSLKYTIKKTFLGFFDLFNMIFIIRFGTILILGYYAFKTDSRISIAMFTMLFSAVLTLDNYASSLSYCLQDYFKACTYQNDFIDLMEMESIFVDGVSEIDHIESIEFKNVTFKYPNTTNYILENVSFVIKDKQKVSLVGLNGAGKTTIIKLLCRFYDVDEDEILVNGINIRLFDYKSYMKLLAIVFQDFKVISFSVKDNIENIDDNQQKLYDVLKRSLVYDRIMSLPNKENTYINKWFDSSGVEFSGGEMQKLALARALYKNCDLVILDEPTSALDPLAEAEIYHHFNEVVGKKITLYISHRLSSCIFSDNILVLDGSKIVESGNHKELMKNNDGLYKKMFDAQGEYYKQ